jgi:hypothetical protein
MKGGNMMTQKSERAINYANGQEKEDPVEEGD